MKTGFIIVGLALIILGLLHENFWRKKEKRANKIKGIVFDYMKNDSGDVDTYHPRIKFNHSDTEYEFTSEYSKAGKPIENGTEVVVLVPENPQEAEWLTAENRVVVSLAPIIMGLVIIFISLQIHT